MTTFVDSHPGRPEHRSFNDISSESMVCDHCPGPGGAHTDRCLNVWRRKRGEKIQRDRTVLAVVPIAANISAGLAEKIFVILTCFV